LTLKPIVLTVEAVFSLTQWIKATEASKIVLSLPSIQWLLEKGKRRSNDQVIEPILEPTVRKMS
jgi:hypothetical protein